MESGSQLSLYQAMWGPLYEATFGILGATGTILPMGDPYHGLPDATTFTTVGAQAATFTWGTDTSWAAFDGHNALADSDTFPYIWQGIIPIIDFNGTDEEADTPDAAFWSTAASSAFTIGIWAKLDILETTFLAKWDENSGGQDREWFFYTNGAGDPGLALYDESENDRIGRRSGDPLSTTTWSFVVATFDGGADAANVDIFVNGVETTNYENIADDSGFVAMDNSDTKVTLGHRLGDGSNSNPAKYFNGQIAGGPMGPFFTNIELSNEQVLRLYNLGRRALAL
jgi:hypothetical protein